MNLVYYSNREGSGFARRVGDDLGWPLIERPDGERVCLNPQLTTIRAASPSEWLAFEAGYDFGHSEAS